MKRKFQVFVSSTFTDLREERQAAVEAILKAGHIPAGMELFTAGSDSQLQVIRRWIEESDIYLLILGGRYGSIEPKSGLSYTEVEFDYARSLGKPFFAVVITDQGLETHVKVDGTSVLEKDNQHKLKAFREKVTSQMCAFFDTAKDVKLAVFESLPQFTETATGGWVAAKDVAPSEDVARQLTALLEENSQLRRDLDKARADLGAATTTTASFQQLAEALASKKLTIPRNVFDPGEQKPELQVSILQAALAYADDLARGVSNASLSASKRESFLFYQVASQLVSFGLAEEGKVPSSVHWQRLKLSKEGIRFLTWARIAKNSVAAGMRQVPAETAAQAAKPPVAKKGRKRSNS